MRGFGSLCGVELVGLDEPSSPWNLRDVSTGERRSGLDNVEVDVYWGCLSVGCCRGDDFVGGEVGFCGFDLLWGDARSAISGWGGGGSALYHRRVDNRGRTFPEGSIRGWWM